ncbi:hypothetical protein QFZ71_001738 [Streptomyces sp. V2I9]|nr:hypothetical protein [Streptomyces sp. V2I9]
MARERCVRQTGDAPRPRVAGTDVVLGGHPVLRGHGRHTKGRPPVHYGGRPFAVYAYGCDQPFSSAATSSAICTAFSAAPLRRLSLETNSARPWSTVSSTRIRPT